MALYKNYTIYAGTAFCEPIDLVDSSGAPINFNNYEVKARMAESGYSESYISINTEVTHYTQGKLQLSLSADETAAIRPGRYVFVVVIIDQYSVPTAIIDGIIDVIPGIGLSSFSYTA
jgi:hypothetical protein